MQDNNKTKKQLVMELANFRPQIAKLQNDRMKCRLIEAAIKKSNDELELSIKKRTAELESTIKLLKEEISRRRHIEKELRITEQNLKTHDIELTESNIALKVLLKQREQDQIEIEKNILSNIKHLIQPYITKLKRNRSMSDEFTYLDILESNLIKIVAPFSSKLSSTYFHFTPKEIQIADLIKDGKQDKDIMEILYISQDTVKSHRKNIRKKLGIYSKRENLRTKLLSLS